MKTGKTKTRTPSLAPMDALIQQALEHHQAHRLDEAEQLYRQVLRTQPRHQDGLNLLGFLLHQRGQHTEAITLIHKAIQIDPKQPLFHNNLGIVLQNSGQTEPAIASYEQALRIDPNHHAALSNLGTLYQAQGRFEEAIRCQERVLHLDPAFFEAHANLGNIHCELKQFEQAVPCYLQAIKLKPDYVNAMHNLAYALQKLERLTEALHWLDQALTLRPDYIEALNCQGNVLQDLGRWNEAIACYQKALQIQPHYHEALCNLGNVLCDQGRLEESIACHQQALAIKPDLHQSYTHMGNAYQMQERMDEAMASYRQALAIHPGDETALENLGVACNVVGDLTGAIACSRQLLTVKRDDPNVIATLLNLMRQACDWSDSEPLLAEMMRLFHTTQKIINPFVFLTLPTTPQEQKRCAEIYMERKYRARRNLAAQPTHDPDPQRLRIGYLSCDFLNHATAILMAELIQLHDRSRFEIILYSYGDDDGREMRQRIITAGDRFVELRHVDHENAARQIHADGIHILVELKGYTKGARLEIAAQRPAPLQVSWLGYPGTMGAEHIDYIIADPFIIPHGQEHHYTEKVVRLPHCYQPNDRLRALPESGPSRQACGLPAEGLIFANFNQTYKITPEIFAAWMALLRQVPDSILWQLESNPLVADNLRQAASQAGIDPTRLCFAPKLSVPDHLARYHLVDLVLDTYPVTSHTTASDALWIGAPLITIAGDTFVARVAGSLLHTIGAPELVTHSLEEYTRLALELARDPERLRALRTRLQANRASTPLFDTPRFTHDLEAVYEAIWQRHAAGLPPDHIDIPPSAPTSDLAMPTPTTPMPRFVAAPTPTPAHAVQTEAAHTPIHLSICITVEPDQRSLLAATLESLQWTIQPEQTIEIVVIDLPRQPREQPILMPAVPGFPCARRMMFPHALTGAERIHAALLQGKGRFLLHLGCGDRLVPEVVWSELHWLEQHPEAAATHAPWQIWHEATREDLGCFYSLDQVHTFGATQGAELFNFIVQNQIFPEVAIHRAACFTRTAFDPQGVFSPLLLLFRTLPHGTIRFQPQPFLVSVMRPLAAGSDTAANQVIHQLDHYRAGLELAASAAISAIGMQEFAPGNREVVLDLINDFLVRRLLVAANLMQAQGDAMAAVFCLKRALLWSKSDADRQFIRGQEATLMTAAAYQAIRARFDALPGVTRLVCCEVSNPEVIRAGLRMIAPAMPTEVGGLTTIQQADGSQALYLTEQEPVRTALLQSGIPAGQVLLIADLLQMFRIAG
ncbi:MAG: tetratricopeptide repeat protein [Magnetococcales bacterium]|nr:tetratricopeptide repeat protein [Magnetococcales bacterium]